MQSVESIIETTMARLKTIVDVNTIVGEPIPAGNGVVVPVSKVSFGFFSGGGEYAPMGKVAGAALAEQKSFPFLPSRPMILPFISSLGRVTTETVRSSVSSWL